MALNMWMLVNWQVYAKKLSWLIWRKCLSIYMMWLSKITERLYEDNQCAISRTFRIPVNYCCTALCMFNGQTQTFERNLLKFAVVVSINVRQLKCPMCLSTKIEYLHFKLGDCLVNSVGIAPREPLDGLQSYLGVEDIFSTHPQRHRGSPSFLYNGYRAFFRVKTAVECFWPPTPFWRRGC